MRTDYYKSKLISVLKQRDFILPALLILTFSQLLSIVFIFCKKERVILVPPVMSQPVWIDGYRVSQTYLMQMGLFLGQLLLSNSAQSILAQMDTVLRYVHPAAYTTVRQYLIREGEHLKKQQGSYHFHVQSTKIDLKTHSIALTGDRESYVGGRRIDAARETYRLTFQFNNGLYLLTACQKEEKPTP